MLTRWTADYVIVGATKVATDRPDGRDMHFAVVVPKDDQVNDTQGIERWGTTYKEYRIPARLFPRLFDKPFPYIARLDFIHWETDKRPKIDKITHFG